MATGISELDFDVFCEILGFLDIWDRVSLLQLNSALYFDSAIWQAALDHPAAVAITHDFRSIEGAPLRRIGFKTASIRRNFSTPAPVSRSIDLLQGGLSLDQYNMFDIIPGTHIALVQRTRTKFGVVAYEVMCLDLRTGKEICQVAYPAGEAIARTRHVPDLREGRIYVAFHIPQSAKRPDREIVVLKVDLSDLDAVNLTEVLRRQLDVGNARQPAHHVHLLQDTLLLLGTTSTSTIFFEMVSLTTPPLGLIKLRGVPFSSEESLLDSPPEPITVHSIVTHDDAFHLIFKAVAEPERHPLLQYSLDIRNERRMARFTLHPFMGRYVPQLTFFPDTSRGIFIFDQNAIDGFWELALTESTSRLDASALPFIDAVESAAPAAGVEEEPETLMKACVSQLGHQFLRATVDKKERRLSKLEFRDFRLRSNLRTGEPDPPQWHSLQIPEDLPGTSLEIDVLSMDISIGVVVLRLAFGSVIHVLQYV